MMTSLEDLSSPGPPSKPSAESPSTLLTGRLWGAQPCSRGFYRWRFPSLWLESGSCSPFLLQLSSPFPALLGSRLHPRLNTLLAKEAAGVSIICHLALQSRHVCVWNQLWLALPAPLPLLHTRVHSLLQSFRKWKTKIRAVLDPGMGARQDDVYKHSENNGII